MNTEMAYLLGMITGNGEIQREKTTTTISIDIPHKRLETEFQKDVGIYVKASITDIRLILEPLLGTSLKFTQNPNISILSFTKPNEEYLMRELMRYIGYATSSNNIRISPEIFDFTLDERKQFVKGINQIAQEGAIQIFQEYNTGMEEIIVGVVGVLQFDVLKYRLENEYKVEIRLENLPYEHIRWIENEEIDMDKIIGTSDMKKIKDLKERPLLLFTHEWSIRMTQERNKGLILSEFGRS